MLQQKINDDFIAAFKAKDEKKDILKMLKAALKQVEIDERKELTDEDVLEILKREAKKRQESIKAYTDGGREDLAEQEEKELVVIKEYLPEMMSEEQVKEIITKIIADTGASSAQDFGKVMGVAMAELKNKAEGSVVQKTVKELLG